MQSSGNLELKNGASVVWGSNTSGNPGAYVTLQDDGKLVLISYEGEKLMSCEYACTGK